MSKLNKSSSHTRNMLVDWLYKASSLPPGEEMYLPVVSKNEQKALFKDLTREKKTLSHLDIARAERLHIFVTFKDMKHWVVIKSVATNSGVAFVKGTDGEIRRDESAVAAVNEDTDRARRLKLMAWSDRMTQTEIEAIEGKLSEEEIKWLF